MAAHVHTKTQCQPQTYSTGLKLCLLISMYICQALPIGVINTGLPVILRREGVSLQQIGLLYLLFLPWAFKFLHASIVDRYYIKRLGRRRTWIFPLQWVSAVVLLGIAFTPCATSFRPMIVLLFLLSLVTVTNDIAVDGYAIDMLTATERPWGNVAQVGGFYFGMIFGGGVLLVIYNATGWQTTFMLVAAAVMLLSLPSVLHKEIPPVKTDIQQLGGAFKPSAWGFLKQRETLWFLLLISLVSSVFSASFLMRTPFMTDLGYDPGVIGGLQLRYGYITAIAGTILSGWLLHRLDARRLLLATLFISAGMAGVTVSIASGVSFGGRLITIVIASDYLAYGISMVVLCTMMMRFSVGPQAGTNFAVLNGLGMIAPMIAGPILGTIGDTYGHAVMFGLIGICIIFVMILVNFILKHRLPEFMHINGNGGDPS